MGSWNDEPGVIELPDGRCLRGTGVRRPREGILDPEFAVYLLSREPEETSWPRRWIRWPDFRVPRDSIDAGSILREAYERAASERVEIACGAGVGRTGTALALISAFGGVSLDGTVSWVREHYHRRAVETPAQRRWISAAYIADSARRG